MNINKVLDELKHHSLTEYDIKDIAIKCIRKDFNEKYDIYLNEKLIDKYNIETIEDSVKSIEYKMIRVFDNMKIAKIFYHFNDVKFSLIEITDKTVVLHRYSNSSNSEIIYSIQYAITGSFDKDYHNVNSLMDNNNPRIAYDTLNWILNIDQVNVKSQINGKIKITGLSQDQKNRLKAAFDIVTKYRNVTIS